MKEIFAGYNISTYKVVSFQYDKDTGFIWLIYPSGHKRFVDQPPCATEEDARETVRAVYGRSYHLRAK